MDEATVTGLALAAKAGDRSAAAAFVRATQQQVYRFLTYLANPRDAEDLTQETFLRAMRALPQFAARSSASTWLYSIARRVAADHHRSAAARPKITDVPDLGAAVDAAIPGSRFEEQVALRELLDDLPADRRLAFVATQVLGLSYAEAAELCDCPVGTIRSRVARAREDLVAALHSGGHRPSRGAGSAGNLAS